MTRLWSLGKDSCKKSREILWVEAFAMCWTPLFCPSDPLATLSVPLCAPEAGLHVPCWLGSVNRVSWQKRQGKEGNEIWILLPLTPSTKGVAALKAALCTHSSLGILPPMSLPTLQWRHWLVQKSPRLPAVTRGRPGREGALPGGPHSIDLNGSATYDETFKKVQTKESFLLFHSLLVSFLEP